MIISWVLPAIWLYVFVSLMAFAVYPLVNGLFGCRRAAAWAASRAFVLLAVGAASFLFGYCGALLSPKRLAMLVILGLLLVSVRLWLTGARRLPTLGAVAGIELAAATAYAGVLALRSFNAGIAGAEKFWDFALLNAVLRAPRFPVEDPWMAGLPVNYYYLGHAAAAWPLGLLGIDSGVGYNLSLGLWCAAAMACAIGLGLWATGRAWGGALGGFAVLVMGNLHAVAQTAHKAALLPFDYWPSSRIVPGTINEFPFFSFLHADLHPHLLNVPFTLLCLVVFGALFVRRGEPAIGRTEQGAAAAPSRVAIAVMGAVLLGGVFAANSWDAAGFGILAALAFVVGGGRGRTAALLGCWIGAMVLFLPFFMRLQSPFYGFGLVGAGQGSRLSDLATEWGILAAVPAAVAIGGGIALLRRAGAARPWMVVAGLAAALMALAAIAAGYGAIFVFGGLSLLLVLRARWIADPTDRYFHLVAAAGLALIAVPELVYARDAFGGELRRMNTVFKLHCEAWLFLGAALPALLRTILTWAGARRAARFGAVTCVGVLLAAQAVYPVLASADRFRYGRRPATLDGLAYLASDRPDEYRAIHYLRTRQDEIRARLAAPGEAGRLGLVVLEATGEPYDYSARVSSNTGIATVLGWENHERVWRKDTGERRSDVEAVFSATGACAEAAPCPSAEAVVRDLAIEKYGVNIVFIGDLERSLYSEAALEKFDSGVLLYSSGSVKVYGYRQEPPAQRTAKSAGKRR